MTRRQWLDAMSGATVGTTVMSALAFNSCAGSSMAQNSFRFGICHETFQKATLAEACATARKIGYHGIELDPSVLATDPTRIGTTERAVMRRMIAESGLQYLGLHNVLKSTSASYHISTPNLALRKKSWDYLRRIVDLAADLGDAPVIVLGSGNQRNAIDGMTPADASRVIADGLASLAPHARSRGGHVLLEPLAPHLSNVFCTLEQTSSVVREIANPSIQTILDTHNTAAESKSVEDLVQDYLPMLRHVHVNEMDGSYPGNANYPFGRLLSALHKVNYAHWVSVEIFKFPMDGTELAKRSLEHLQAQLASLSLQARTFRNNGPTLPSSHRVGTTRHLNEAHNWRNTEDQTISGFPG